MKDLVTSIAAVLAAASAATATATASSIENNSPSDAILKLVGEAAGDWTSSLACTADVSDSNPSLVDETSCATATDADGNACVWCDAAATLGTGICASVDTKMMIGPYWDQLCGTGGGGGGSSGPVDPPAPVPVPVVPVTPMPTPKPTPNPTDPPVPPPPAPAPGNDVLSCSMDASSNLISDEGTCVALVDGTSASGEMCVWCQVPVIGGSCITNSMQSSVGFLCRGEEDETKNNLRGGDVGVGGGSWKALDPSCLGDNGLNGNQDDCAARADSTGDACIWCDAGNDVFGICAAPSQRDYLGGYMNCAGDATVAETPVAVE